MIESEALEKMAEAERKLIEQAEAEKQARVEQLHRMAARRIGKQSLTRGFNAWEEVRGKS